jgi:hypothetical protein
MSKTQKNLGDHPLVVIIFVIASLAGIIVFLTGRSSLPEILSGGTLSSTEVVNTQKLPKPTSALPDNENGQAIANPPSTLAATDTSSRIVATPHVESTETVTILGNDFDGTTWNAPATGSYVVRYANGAYNGWKNDAACTTTDHVAEGCWKTTVFIYKNCDIKWIRTSPTATLDEPGNFDFRIGLDSWQLSAEKAEELAKNTDPIPPIFLQAGDCLKFLTIDGYDTKAGYSAYDDNQGSVNVTVSLLSK